MGSARQGPTRRSDAGSGADGGPAQIEVCQSAGGSASARPMISGLLHSLPRLVSRGGQVHAEQMAKHLLCRIGLHKWSKRVNDSGQPYLTCLRCGKHDDNEGGAAPLGWN